jgi:hypothetical protein
MKSSVKVLFLHFASETRDAKAARIARSGVDLVVEEPRWPRFYELARRERPAAVIVDFSRGPAHALETISKAKDTRDLELYAIHVFDERRELLKERVPRAQAMSERELAQKLAERLPEWEAQRAQAEEAARLERQHRADERRAAAASRAQARRAAAAAAAGQTAPAPAGEKKAAAAPGARKPARKAPPTRPTKSSVRKAAGKSRAKAVSARAGKPRTARPNARKKAARAPHKKK